MAARMMIALLSALAVTSGMVACERSRVSQPRDTAAALPPVTVSLPEAPLPSPKVAVAEAVAVSPDDDEVVPPEDDAEVDATTIVFPKDSVLLRQAVQAFLARSLYLRWAPDPADNSMDRICDPDRDGYYLQAAWGLARARVIGLSFNDSTGARASAHVEVVRVLSLEGDPETSDGRYARADMMVVAPVRATIELTMRRRQDGRWIQCAPVFDEVDGVSFPMSLTGPPADTLAPRGRKLSRIVPAVATWQRVRVLADSIGRARVP
jgi:hypothetical protein